MRIVRHFKDLPRDARGAAVAIGNFDGVHRGHQAVIGEAGRIARADGLPWAVLTFEPHPRSVFQPTIAPFRLTPLRAKAQAIAALGVDCLVVLRFDRSFSQRSAQAFVKEILVGGLGARHVISGYNFVFGQGRGGNCELLLRMGREEGFDFTAVSAVHSEAGQALSSSRAREHLLNADPRGAAGILGRPFEIEGRVRRGDQRGRTIGFPTANIDLGTYLRPANGVYAVRAGIANDAGMQWHDGVANLGQRPTFDKNEVALEVFLFGFAADLYGRRMRVQMIDYIRSEKRFDGLAALKAQIANDCDAARRLLAGER
jgi:riboflavin kinase/FMN adenylyltransferase